MPGREDLPGDGGDTMNISSREEMHDDDDTYEDENTESESEDGSSEEETWPYKKEIQDADEHVTVDNHEACNQLAPRRPRRSSRQCIFHEAHPTSNVTNPLGNKTPVTDDPPSATKPQARTPAGYTCATQPVAELITSSAPVPSTDACISAPLEPTPVPSNTPRATDPSLPEAKLAMDFDRILHSPHVLAKDFLTQIEVQMMANQELATHRVDKIRHELVSSREKVQDLEEKLRAANTERTALVKTIKNLETAKVALEREIETHKEAREKLTSAAARQNQTYLDAVENLKIYSNQETLHAESLKALNDGRVEMEKRLKSYVESNRKQAEENELLNRKNAELVEHLNGVGEREGGKDKTIRGMAAELEALREQLKRFSGLEAAVRNFFPTTGGSGTS
ncbi:hypothetical protein BJX70DRAFT_395305 [Aspergillus crustosus]